jgi:hypothetical protein
MESYYELALYRPVVGLIFILCGTTLDTFNNA